MISQFECNGTEKLNLNVHPRYVETGGEKNVKYANIPDKEANAKLVKSDGEKIPEQDVCHKNGRTAQSHYIPI